MKNVLHCSVQRQFAVRSDNKGHATLEPKLVTRLHATVAHRYGR